MMGRTIRVPPTRVNSLLHSSSQSGQGNSTRSPTKYGDLSQAPFPAWRTDPGCQHHGPYAPRCSGRPFRACRGRRWAERALAALNSYTIQTARDQRRRANHVAPSENMLEWIRSRKRSSPAVVCPCPETHTPSGPVGTPQSVPFSVGRHGGGGLLTVPRQRLTLLRLPARSQGKSKNVQPTFTTLGSYRVQAPRERPGTRLRAVRTTVARQKSRRWALGRPHTPYCVTLVPDRTRKRKESQDAGLGHDGAELYNCHSLSPSQHTSLGWSNIINNPQPHAPCPLQPPLVLAVVVVDLHALISHHPPSLEAL